MQHSAVTVTELCRVLEACADGADGAGGAAEIDAAQGGEWGIRLPPQRQTDCQKDSRPRLKEAERPTVRTASQLTRKVGPPSFPQTDLAWHGMPRGGPLPMARRIISRPMGLCSSLNGEVYFARLSKGMPLWSSATSMLCSLTN